MERLSILMLTISQLKCRESGSKQQKKTLFDLQALKGPCFGDNLVALGSILPEHLPQRTSILQRRNVETAKGSGVGVVWR